ncbi:DedA family protein [Aquicoccus sp. SCR17]|nr:DedA family protein [Carideicomes alvinocaridis]
MSDWLYGYIAAFGTPLLFLTTFASCLALPVPSSLMMLAAGAFAASGDLSLLSVVLAALAGAVAGDQAGYWLGTRGGRWIDRATSKGKARAAADRARDMLERRGGVAVFLSRWLASPLGPYVNFAAGATRMDRRRFTLWDVAGEAVWVTIYVGLGWLFGERIDMIETVTGNISGLLAGLVLLAGSFALLRQQLREHRQRQEHASAHGDGRGQKHGRRSGD